VTLKYIYHHLGLGDHIICNGLVRHYCKLYDNIVLFSYTHNLDNVSYMYKDLKNLEIFDFKSESEIVEFIIKNNLQSNLIRVGFEKLNEYLDKMTFDQAFYNMIGLDFSIRFDQFYFNQNKKTENLVCKTLNPNNEKYIFVIDDPKRGYNIDMNKVTDGYKIIRNDYQFKLFDYIKLLKNAEEIHTMQTAFLDLINSYKMDKPKIYRHTYVRQYESSIHSVGLNSIIEIY